MSYKLYRAQQLNCDINTAWDFFSSAQNLSKITPKEMNFIVRTPTADDAIYQGMIIDYYVSPLFGIKMKWKTEITQVAFQRSFTDFQKSGPYKRWNHHHEFIINENGVLMKDTVDYELPLGFLGKITHFLFVRKKLNYVFDYRHKILEELFNKL